LAKQLKILCAGGFRAAMDRLAPLFEAASGTSLALTYATPGRTRELLAEGFAFDAGVVVASVLARAKADGLPATGADFKLAVSPIGMGVPEDGPALSVASLADFAATLAALESVGLSDPKAGTNLANEVIASASQHGLADTLRAKALFIDGPGSVVSARVAAGLAQAVITLSSEIVPIEGVRFLGRLPAELQTEYAMQAVLPVRPDADASALMDFLRGAEARAVMEAVGLASLA
jgi:molybdate transport system substrate-binding protein